MPLLRNPRHERLALELAGGKSATAAYAAAGFTPNRSNAGKLRRKEHILRRVEELLVEHESTQTLATQHAIETTGLTKAWVIEMLRMNAERALQEREVIESGECRLRKPKMSYQRILIATLITIIACVSSTEIQACKVALQVQNKATFTVLEIVYRKQGWEFWRDTMISNSNEIKPNDSKVVRWYGDGDYEISIRSSNAPNNPVAIKAPDICAKSQIIVRNAGTIVR